jgi:Nitrile hydratase, alpha chain
VPAKTADSRSVVREQYTDQLIQRAERDDEFRAKLIADPRAALREELGVDAPESLAIRVIEEDPAEVVLVLPPKSRPDALTDEQLAGVAGGSWSGCVTPATPDITC